jgi:hypothetical protein
MPKVHERNFLSSACVFNMFRLLFAVVNISKNALSPLTVHLLFTGCEAGMPRTLAMRISGHRTESMYRRYAIASESDKSVATERMERYFEGITPVVEDEIKGSVQ